MLIDYQWILTSPSLMNLTDDMDATLWLKHLYLQKKSIHEETNFPVAHPTRRLGIHYENIMNSILNTLLEPIDIKRNIQVSGNNKTLGEFDFIGGNQQQGFHLECAVKYYLRVGSGAQLSDFVGPQKRDRLDIKWERMCTKQITLSTTNEGKKVCQQLGILPSDKKILIQGFLFHPYSEQPCPDLHPSINPEHHKGWWLREKDIHLFNPSDQFILMQKPYWLSAQNCYEETKDREEMEILNVETLKMLASTADRPLLFSRGSLIDEKWNERDRGFIVGNEW